MGKTLLLFIVGIVTLILIPIIVVAVKNQQELRSRAAPATTLSFLPVQLSKNVGDTFNLDIHIDTGTNDVTLVKIDLAFDAAALEALSITNGSLAPRIYSPGTVAPGIASIGVGAESQLRPISGSGTVATLRMKVIAVPVTPVSVQFSPTTVVSGLGESTPNVLTGTTAALITVAGGQTLSPSLTPTPSGSTPIPTSSVGTPTITSGLTPTPTTYNLPASPTGGQLTTTPTTQSGTLVTGLTQEALPQSGSFEITLLLLGIAGFFIISGLVIL